jgi:hypothetical protein
LFLHKLPSGTEIELKKPPMAAGFEGDTL